MEVKVISEHGYVEAAFGLGLSYGKTSNIDFYDYDIDDLARQHSTMAKLAGKGNGHDKFLRMMTVYLDITAPIYWWKEMMTYSVGVVVQSESTMHTLGKKLLTPDMFELQNMSGYKKEIEQFSPNFDFDDEEWAEYPKNPSYLVSNMGRVRRLTITANKHTYNERILKNTLTNDGYFKVGIKIDNKQKDYRVHRMVAETFIPNPQGLPEVNHKDGNKLNNQISNLEWCSSSYNQLHAIENNLQPKKVRTYTGKFTKEQRDEIISRWNSGESRRAIANSLGVSHTCINDIIKHKYAYLPKENYYKHFKEDVIAPINNLILQWQETKDKEIWQQIVNLLPMSFLQRRIVMCNYAVLQNIFRQRKDHKLAEWNYFIDSIRKQLSYSCFIF